MAKGASVGKGVQRNIRTSSTETKTRIGLEGWSGKWAVAIAWVLFVYLGVGVPPLLSPQVANCEASQIPAHLASLSVPAAPACGDPTGDHVVTASDALFLLQSAVGLEACMLCICDVDDSGRATATDALAVLKHAVGLGIELLCAECPAPTCGNDIWESGERCDGSDLHRRSCAAMGFTGGTLACAANCDGYDSSGCDLPAAPPVDPRRLLRHPTRRLHPRSRRALSSCTRALT